MASEKILESKKAKVAALTEKLQNSVSFVLVDYKGITVEEDTKLRKELREAGVSYTVEKNSMLRFALKEMGIVDSFEDVLEAVKLYFQENLSKEHMAGRMNELIAIEKHKILKWAPLELKNRCIRAGAKMAEQEVTAVLSNMSVVKMPEDYAQYIEKFGVYTSTNRTELCICSFQDTLSLGFTSRYDSTNIQRNFYRILKELGASVKVAEPDFPEDARPNYEGKKVLQIFTFCCIAAIVISMMTDIIC